MAFPKIVLKPITSGDDGTIVVAQTPFRIGRRAEDNQAQIARPDISSRHADLRLVEGEWWVFDNGSTNGTFVNGQRVQGSARLAVADEVYFATRGYVVLAKSDADDSPLYSTRVINDAQEIKAVMELPRVISENRTTAHFQPLVDLRTGAVVGWESLGRAVTDEGQAGPAALFRLAKQHNVEARLSQSFRAAAQACVECGFCWPPVERQYQFLNMHPAEVDEENFGQLLEMLQRTAMVQAYRIVLEVPESWVCKTEEMRDRVRRIHEAGLLVAYDDFGAGQSRIPDLISVPPDFLKLDRELVAELGANRVKRSIVQAILDACQELKVTTIGEGIESAEEEQACREMGVDLGQGYHLGRPKSAFDQFAADRTKLPATCQFVRLHVV